MESGRHTVVLGGGVCGLYAALTLLRNGENVTLLEKEAQAGGLAAGQRHGGNFYDLGVHMLHAFDQEVFEDCAAMMGDERVEVPLDARIKWAGRSYHYPLRGRDILSGIPLVTLFRCIVGLLVAELRGVFRSGEEQDAEEALIALYGVGLYEYFFEDFTERYWGHHPRDLSAQFVRRKMPRLSAFDWVKNFFEHLGLSKKADRVEGALREEVLHYSESGSETLPRKMLEEVVRLGGRVELEAELSGIEIDGDRVRAVQWTSRSEELHSLACDRCISTVPVTALVNSFPLDKAARVRQHLDGLAYKPIVVYGLLVKRSRCMEGLYTYYRDCLFHRVGEPKNAGMVVQPDGHTVLIVEMTCNEGDGKWRLSQDVKEQIIGDLEREGLCEGGEILEWHRLRNLHGYPVFRKGYETHLAAVEAFLSTMGNLKSTGRQGGFCYPNMHQAMRMGQRAAIELLAQ